MTRHPTDRASLERDCSVDLLRAGGPGGQHADRRETAVRLTHGPTGLVVIASERRSQHQNKEAAFERMAERIEAAQRPRKRRRPTRPTLGSVKRRLSGKKKQGEKKALRRGPTD